MSNSMRLTVPYLEVGQAQKEITHNEALTDLDYVVQASAISRTLSTPPVTPANGDSYIVGSSPTGAWSGWAGRLAYFYQGWRSKAPLAGWLCWSQAENRLLVQQGGAWQNLATPYLTGSLVWDPPSVAAASSTQSAAITITGAAFGDMVQVAAPYDLQGMVAQAAVSSANNVVITLLNPTGAAINLASGTWQLRVVKA